MSGGGAETPQPTAQEKALAQVGAEQWNDYARRYAGPGGVNEQFIAKTRATEGGRMAAAGQVGADAAMAAHQAKQGTVSAGLARGISSVSGASIAGKAKDVTTLAGAEGRAKAQAVQGVDDAQLAADLKLASFGRGLSSDAQVGLQRNTARATELLNKSAVSRFQEKQALMGAVGTGVGMYAQTQDLFKRKS